MTELTAANIDTAKRTSLLPVRFLLTSVVALSALKMVVIIIGNMGWL